MSMLRPLPAYAVRTMGYPIHIVANVFMVAAQLHSGGRFSAGHVCDCLCQRGIYANEGHARETPGAAEGSS